MCWRNSEGRTFDFSLWIYQFLSWLHNGKTRRGDMAREGAEIKIGTDASDDIFLLHLPLLAPSLATIVITPSSHYGPRKSQKLQLGIHISFKLWLRNKLAKYLLRYEEDATRRGAMRHCRTLCLKNHTHTHLLGTFLIYRSSAGIGASRSSSSSIIMISAFPKNIIIILVSTLNCSIIDLRSQVGNHF